MSEVNTTSFSHPPHFKTYTEVGKSHFGRLVDALAEFVDNSIEACNGKAERNIHVSFFINDKREKGTSFVTIFDNGVGMTDENLKDFATYALDKKSRGINETHSAAIGKFGVGAKEAGFYLGNQIKILTKCEDTNLVTEFSLDEEVFKKRYENNEDPFTSYLVHREKREASRSVPQDESCVDALQTAVKFHEENNKSFTIIVIRMSEEKVGQLLMNDKYRDISNELAEIYHFHLFPDHLPASIKLEKFKKAGGTAR